jgi:alpha-beta hydrolase superfamily lysophospholipase
VKRLVLVAVVLLAGCGGAKDRVSGPPLPEIAKRCGAAHADWKTLWLKASDGTKLDGAEAGSGSRGVLMLHESPSDLCGPEPYGAELVRQGFHVLLVDLRAYGLSQRGPYGGRRGAVADVRGAVDELKHRGAKEVAVVGASYGGITALAAAPELGPDISGVASLSGELELRNAGLNALAAMPQIQVPMLIMGSRKDPLLDEEEARTLLRAATGAPAQLVEFNGSDHGWNLLDPPHKQHAYAVLVGFLRSVTE